MTYLTTTLRNVKALICSLLLCLSVIQSNVFAASLAAQGGRPAIDYLPDNVSYNSAIPTPESVLGANVGAWHVRHDQLVDYMRTLARVSDRITLTQTGVTHENRPLLLLTITAPGNRTKVAGWRQQHIENVEKGTKPAKDAPLFLYMGYSIHGNEPSGSNASLLIAYYLAAAQGPAIDALLDNNVVLLDPSLNPDGLSRFAQWANMHRGQNRVSDPNHREHWEGWPNGRTNHYWFDLNRDWLLLTHPESRARIAQFQAWRPQVLTDFHEMGTDGTYFFQPGVRARKNPLTPDGNVTLTEALAAYHAKAFDAQGTLYYTEEGFDDFYAGKGSTYPDLHGSIGILFEQASSRGHVQESINGPLTFEQTIANQVTTSLSTFAGAIATKPAILEYQGAFYRQTQADIEGDEDYGYVLAMQKDTARFDAMMDILRQHHIQTQVISKSLTIDGKRFDAGKALFVPLNQTQYRLVKSLFSTQRRFADNTFYDVSNWNLPLAFDITWAAVDKGDRRDIKTDANAQLAKEQATALPANAYAYAFDWYHYQAPALLQKLLQAGVQVRSATGAFTATLTNGESREFAAGSIVIPAGLSQQPDNLAALIQHAADSLAMPVAAMSTGLTPAGMDIGSRSMAPLTLPHVLVLGGEGTSQYEVGEIWHYFDTRVGLPVTILEQQHLKDIALNDYTHLIVASGGYAGIDDKTTARIGEWVQQGGVLIGQKSALRWFDKQGWLNIEIASTESIDNAFPTQHLTYADKSALAAKKIIAGSVYDVQIDPSHPLFYGFDGPRLPMFKTSNLIVRSETNPFTTVATYADSPLMAGYSADELVGMIAHSTAVVAQPKGDGVVIGFTDDVAFRGYWRGTDKLLSNAVYQSALID